MGTHIKAWIRRHGAGGASAAVGALERVAPIAANGHIPHSDAGDGALGLASAAYIFKIIGVFMLSAFGYHA